MLAQKLTAQEKELQDLKAKTELFLSLNPGTDTDTRRDVLSQLEVCCVRRCQLNCLNRMHSVTRLLNLTDIKVLIRFFNLLQLKRKEHEQLLTQLKRDYAVQMSVLMSGQQTYGESSAQLTSSSHVPSPRSGLPGPSSDRGGRCSSIIPGSLSQSALYPSVHQSLNTNSPSGGISATLGYSNSNQSFANVGSSVPLLETCYPEAPQVAKTTRLWTQHDIFQPAGFPVENCETLQGNFYNQIDNTGVSSCDAGSSLQMTDSPSVHVSDQRGLTATTGAQRAPPNSSAFLPDAKTMQQRVPCSNPDECPTGGKCYLFTET